MVGKETVVFTNESFSYFTDSVNFMSDKFNFFCKQLQEIIDSIKYIKEENSILKVKTIIYVINLMCCKKKMNNLEHLFYLNHLKMLLKLLAS